MPVTILQALLIYGVGAVIALLVAALIWAGKQLLLRAEHRREEKNT